MCPDTRLLIVCGSIDPNFQTEDQITNSVWISIQIFKTASMWYLTAGIRDTNRIALHGH